MSARPRLVRSIPFWILLAGSLATSGFGLWLTTDKLGIMADKLADGTATGLEVYVGQVWAIIGGILIATGLIGLALALVLGVVRSFVARPSIELVAIDETVEVADAVVEVAEVADVAEMTPATPVTVVEPTAEPAPESAPQR